MKGGTEAPPYAWNLYYIGCFLLYYKNLVGRGVSTRRRSL